MRVNTVPRIFTYFLIFVIISVMSIVYIIDVFDLYTKIGLSLNFDAKVIGLSVIGIAVGPLLYAIDLHITRFVRSFIRDNTFIDGSSINQIKFFSTTMQKLLSNKSFQKKLLCKKISQEKKTEILGREARRFFFDELLKKTGSKIISLGHHADDQIETFFVRLARGTTLDGIGGMMTLHDNYFRPLLQIRKDEIIDFLEKNKIQFVIDKTNKSQEFLRNRVRSLIVPSLNKVDKRLYKKILEFMDSARETNYSFKELLQLAFEKVFVNRTVALHKNRLPAKNSSTFIGLRSSFIKFGAKVRLSLLASLLIYEKSPLQLSRSLLLEIDRFLNRRNGGKHKVGSNLTVVKKEGFFWLQKDRFEK